MKRALLIPVALAAVLILLAACAAPAATAPAGSSAAAEATGKTFTAEELAKYNGKDGNPAYIAVDGVVYDVTDVPEWRGGDHQGRFEAGRDLTEEIKTISPHGTSKLKGLPVVGTLVK